MFQQQHFLYQIANLLFCLAYLLPFSTPKVMTIMRTCFMVGYLICCYWSWNILCSSSLFAWNFIFVLINLSQLLFAFYKMGTLNLNEDMIQLYYRLLKPLHVDKMIYQKFASPHNCYITKMKPGQTFALKNFTLFNNLLILLSGRASVFDKKKFLHHIYPYEFMDSTEYQSVRKSGDDKFQVSIFCTAPHTSYVTWDRKNLEYHFESYASLRQAFNLLINRDIVNKLYAINEMYFKIPKKMNNLTQEKTLKVIPFLDLRLQLMLSILSAVDDKDSNESFQPPTRQIFKSQDDDPTQNGVEKDPITKLHDYINHCFEGVDRCHLKNINSIFRIEETKLNGVIVNGEPIDMSEADEGEELYNSKFTKVKDWIFQSVRDVRRSLAWKFVKYDIFNLRDPIKRKESIIEVTKLTHHPENGKDEEFSIRDLNKLRNKLKMERYLKAKLLIPLPTA